ncbi:MAG: polyprenyl synthetase family protein [Bdellovibrionales bacterium]|nr:polyprenyl synthetase family protein [Bdellovibrionales bacterium]
MGRDFVSLSDRRKAISSMYREEKQFLNDPSHKQNWALVEEEIISEIKDQMTNFVVRFSSGELRKMCLDHLSNPGKMIRSRLILSAGQILDIPKTHLFNWAAACEFVHEASLIHDDLQDRDIIRRGKPSFWNKYGEAHAISVGDFFLMLSFRPLVELPSDLVDIHSAAALRLAQGQVDELNLSQIKPRQGYFENYLRCIEGKTGALFLSLMQGLTCLSKISLTEKKLLNQSFLELGIIFQMQDDILDLFGQKKRQAQGSDILEGKYSLLVALHLDEHKHDFEKIINILSKDRSETSLGEVEEIKSLFINSGTLNKAISVLLHYVNRVTKNPLMPAKFVNYFELATTKILTPIVHLISRDDHA